MSREPTTPVRPWPRARIFLACAAASFALLGVAADARPRPADRDALKRTLANVVERGPLKNARVGVWVQSLEDGEVVFAHNPDELLNPASNVKLFTAAAALEKLGPEFTFETEFLIDAEGSSSQPRTLYVRGKGDPSLTTDRLFGLVSELQHAGLKEVTGDLVIDDGYFDEERTAPGFDQESSDRPYMAPTGAVSLNWNTVSILVRPAEREGGRAIVDLEPHSDHFVLQSSAVTGGRYRRVSVTSTPLGDRQQITVRGSIPVGRRGFWVGKKIDNPPMYFAYTLRNLLAQRGVKVRGKIRLGTVPANARLLYAAQSESLDIVLKRLNKRSNNFVAEQLLKALGAAGKGSPGSFDKGVAVVEDVLEAQVGIPRGSYVMKNGSGLNDANRFSVAQTSKLLRYMYDRFTLSPEFLSSMGIAGKDGTLRERFEGSDAVGRLRAKTGTLKQISTLSGYVQSLGGERFIFAIFINDYLGSPEPVRQGLDALGAAVAASGSAQGPDRAVAQILTREAVVAPLEEVKTRVRTFLSLGAQRDARNVPFLRTAWRNEKDPAVRAVLADCIFQSNPDDYAAARALLESFATSAQVYGRLRQVARELEIEVPAVGSLIELAAEGNSDALARLAEVSAAAGGDERSEGELASALSDVARTAPEELLGALRTVQASEREATLGLLARGMMQAADHEHPFWPALRRTMGSVDPQMAAFARAADKDLSLRIAEARAPKIVVVPAEVHKPAPAPAAQTAESRPGG